MSEAVSDSEGVGCSAQLPSVIMVLVVASSWGMAVRTTGGSPDVASFVSHGITAEPCNWSTWWRQNILGATCCIEQRSRLCTNSFQYWVPTHHRPALVDPLAAGEVHSSLSPKLDLFDDFWLVDIDLSSVKARLEVSAHQQH